MSIVTKTGDAGTTALMFGRRVSKCDSRVDAYGTVDELNAALGLARATVTDPWIGERLPPIQRDLITLMGELATHPEDQARFAKAGFVQVDAAFTARVDQLVQEVEAGGVQYQGWATPGATPGAAALDLARTICRRAERRICALHERNELHNPDILIFLNRLSDLLWLLARREENAVPSRPPTGNASV